MSLSLTSPKYSPSYSPSFPPRDASGDNAFTVPSLVLERSDSTLPALSLLRRDDEGRKRVREEEEDAAPPARRRMFGACTNDALHNIRKTRDEVLYELAQAELAVERLKTHLVRLSEREASVLEELVDDRLSKIEYIYDRYGATPSNPTSLRFIEGLGVPALEDHIKVVDKAYQEVSRYDEYTPLTGCSCFNDK
jgi:hypothetical protein